MRLHVENRAAIGVGAGLALTFAALGGRMTVGDSSAEFAAVAAREAALERSVTGMPRQRDILAARTVLKPGVDNNQLSDYYGDPVECSDNNKRDFRMVAMACAVLSDARSKIESFVKLKAEDTELATLRSTLDTKSKLGLVLTGIGGVAMSVAMLSGIIWIGRQNRKEVQEAA